MVEVDVASYTDDLVAGVTATIVVVVSFANVIFADYIVFVTVDVVVAAGFVVLFVVVVVVDDASVPVVAHLDA